MTPIDLFLENCKQLACMRETASGTMETTTDDMPPPKFLTTTAVVTTTTEAVAGM